MKNKVMFPLFVSLEGKKILVVGGGKIAARRVKTLTSFDFGAEVRVVSPMLCEELENLRQQGRMVWVQEAYGSASLMDADMVLICTDDERINRQIHEDCRMRGILVNVASDQTLCDFQFPGMIMEDEVVIAFNGSGRNHSKVKRMREKVETYLASGLASDGRTEEVEKE